MTRTKLSGLAARASCVALAACLWTAERQIAFAQAKPEAPAAPAQNQAGAAQQPAAAQPVAQPPATQKPATPQPPAAKPAVGVQAQPGGPRPIPVAPPPSAKPIVGPPDPSKPQAEQAGAGHAQPEIPKPTVELKPGEVPAIKFDVPDYSFGRVSAGQVVLHDFWYMNTGNGPLEILSIKPA